MKTSFAVMIAALFGIGVGHFGSQWAHPITREAPRETIQSAASPADEAQPVYWTPTDDAEYEASYEPRRTSTSSSSSSSSTLALWTTTTYAPSCVILSVYGSAGTATYLHVAR